MNEASEAQNAIEAMNGKEMEGRPLKVNEAKPREDRPKRKFRLVTPTMMRIPHH